uniref:RING-type domain-containing protein n=1 Tax=Kalanchoe fedtschenkoi TaxID=63787 RepID=A0A7N0SWW7_KALFE
MNWNPQMEVHYINTGYPYSTTASFMEFFEGLTYDHINFVFSDPLHNQGQENIYPSANTNSNKYGFLDFGTTPYYDDRLPDYEITDHAGRLDEYRRPFGGSLLNNDTTVPINTIQEGYPNTTLREGPIEIGRDHSTLDTQVTWQDTINPDTMSYEELLELGETVGTENRGLTKEVIALLPVSRYKRWFFWRRKSRNERCVVCQMEYKRGDKQITLPCKHVYHAGCGAKWLSINKVSYNIVSFSILFSRILQI